MKIINNKIYIMKGETPTYSGSVIDKDTGAPYVILKDFDKPVVEFTVRSSVYDRDTKFFIRKYIDKNSDDNVRFADSKILSYNELDMSSEPVWNDEIRPADEFIAKKEDKKIVNAYLFGLTRDNVTTYRYCVADVIEDGIVTKSHWAEYEFNITVRFDYDETSVMEPKTYKYEITFFNADIEPITDEVTGNTIDYKLTNITYKSPLQEPEDFIVGGTLSE